MRSLLILILPLLIADQTLSARPSPPNQNFQALKNAKTVLFLGDSITYGGEYVVFFER